MDNTRLVSIDIARGICIILVVIGHYIPDNSPYWYITLHDIIYTFHMPLFMFVSGYVHWLTRRPVKYINFMWKKFQRLMIPYFFVSIIVISIKIFTQNTLSVENPVEISAFLKMLYLPVAGNFLWFVYALFLMFLIIPFFNTNKQLAILLMLSLIIYLLPLSSIDIFCLGYFKANFFYFVMGCALFEWQKVKRIFDGIHFIALLIVFFGLFMMQLYIDNMIIVKILMILISFIGIILILNISKIIEFKDIFLKKALLMISVYSYTIYLFHTTFEGFTKAIVFKVLNQYVELGNQLIFLCISIIIIIAGIVLPIILQKIITRYSRVFSYLIGVKYEGASESKKGNKE